MAQILAILLLATAFAPDIRGAMVKNENGDHSPMWSTAVVRYLAALIALAAIGLDAVVVISGAPAEGAYANTLGLLNAASLGALFMATIYTLTNHVRHDHRKAPSREPRDDDTNLE